jgi:hypothetical protein
MSHSKGSSVKQVILGDVKVGCRIIPVDSLITYNFLNTLEPNGNYMYLPPALTINNSALCPQSEFIGFI